MSTYAATVSVTVTATQEVDERHHRHCERFWTRVSEYGIHRIPEAKWLWNRVKADETRRDLDVAALRFHLERLGAFMDEEIVCLWRLVSGN